MICYLLISTATVAFFCLSWTKAHWFLSITLVIPVFIVMFCLFVILMLRLHRMTREYKATLATLEAIGESDFDTALRVLKTYETGKTVESQDSPDISTNKARLKAPKKKLRRAQRRKRNAKQNLKLKAAKKKLRRAQRRKRKAKRNRR